MEKSGIFNQEVQFTPGPVNFENKRQENNEILLL